VSVRHDDDGSLILNCRLPAEAGARIVKALELALEEVPAAESKCDVPAGTSPQRIPFGVRRADDDTLPRLRELTPSRCAPRRALGQRRHRVIRRVDYRAADR
jgi:hypothetical protein